MSNPARCIVYAMLRTSHAEDVCLRDRGACLSPAGTAPKQLYPFDKRATLRTDDIEGASVPLPPAYPLPYRK
jgi:hypothetical protein